MSTQVSLRVGILGPISWRVPPRHYGGWELVAHHLTEGLVRRGHQVTLFASGDSLTRARLVSVVPRPLSEDAELRRYARAYESLHAAAAFERAGEFDLIHNHLGAYPECYADVCPVPLVTTLHGSGAEPDSKLIYARYRTHPYVSITDAERALIPDLNYVATVYNGVEPDQFPFSAAPGEYLLVLGRMSPDKGIHHAIEVAQRTGMDLVLAGIVPPENEQYFTEQVQPHLDEHIRFVGPANLQQKAKLYAGARAFLHLITYDEAFGLTMVEAMACGCPVIAVRRGSVPELIVDGETGFIVRDVDGAVDAVARLDSIDRAACRRRVEERFTVDRMVEGYEAVYRSCL
ncbi:MAG TPA: glycosyltransferase family 4 protein [Chloroflexota bacterium]|nr:glycosyltransferase family 4 protein [Chloroflexota bacterium]